MQAFEREGEYADWEEPETEDRDFEPPGNLILYGPPGTGKTHHLQSRLIPLYQAGDRFSFVTFHPGYAYEDFVEGIRPEPDPDSGGLRYEVKPGIFRRICALAKADPSRRYALFIDEINRGNIARIFGELITLIEDDKRCVYGCEGSLAKGLEATLPYSGERFGVPANLDIYGTMNTADRSIASLDVALRRRFRFREMPPDPGRIKGTRGDGKISDDEGGWLDLRALLEALNRRLLMLRNRDHLLGHSYFMKCRDLEEVRIALRDQVLPLLQEYFHEDYGHIQRVALGFLLRRAASRTGNLGDTPQDLAGRQDTGTEPGDFAAPAQALPPAALAGVPVRGPGVAAAASRGHFHRQVLPGPRGGPGEWPCPFLQAGRRELPVLRGRLNLTAHVRRLPGDKHRIDCLFDEFDGDIPLNRALRHCLEKLSPLAGSSSLRNILDELLSRFGGVSPWRFDPLELERIRPDRTRTGFAPVWEQCRWLLRGLYPDAAAGHHPNPSLLFDLEDLFEEAVSGAVRRELTPLDYQCHFQGPRRPLLADAGGMRKWPMKPDIHLTSPQGCRIILDCKWKGLDPDRGMFGVSQADLYQLHTYAAEYAARGAGLIYPWAEGLPREPVPFRFREIDIPAWLIFVPMEDFAPGRLIAPLLADLEKGQMPPGDF